MCERLLPGESSNLEVDSFRTSSFISNMKEIPRTHEPERTIIVKDLMDKLSFPAKLVIHIILGMPEELLERIKDKKIGSGKQILERYFTQERHWRRADIKMVWQELQTLVERINEL